jgi:hypothetical protein
VKVTPELERPEHDAAAEDEAKHELDQAHGRGNPFGTRTRCSVGSPGSCIRLLAKLTRSERVIGPWQSGQEAGIGAERK